MSKNYGCWIFPSGYILNVPVCSGDTAYHYEAILNYFNYSKKKYTVSQLYRKAAVDWNWIRVTYPARYCLDGHYDMSFDIVQYNITFPAYRTMCSLISNKNPNNVFIETYSREGSRVGYEKVNGYEARNILRENLRNMVVA